MSDDERPIDRRRFFRQGLRELLKPLSKAVEPLHETNPLGGGQGGRISAANASQICDGASGVLVVNELTTSLSHPRAGPPRSAWIRSSP